MSSINIHGEAEHMGRTKCITYILMLCLLLISSCNKTRSGLPLSEDTAKNNEVIKAYIPIGTPASDAVIKMEREGFTCKIMSNEKVRIRKDRAQSHGVANVDFVWCDRKAGTIVFRRWQVIMNLDNNDQVDGLSVTTGLVGS